MEVNTASLSTFPAAPMLSVILALVGGLLSTFQAINLFICLLPADILKYLDSPLYKKLG